MTAGKWASDWKNVKIDFKEATGKSKPDTAKKILGKISIHKAGIESTLETVDKAWKNYSDSLVDILNAGQNKTEKKQSLLEKSEIDANQCLNKFGFAVGDFQRAEAAYSKAIEKSIDDELKSIASSGDLKTIYYKSCKMMQKTLDSISKEIIAQQKSLFITLQETIKAGKSGKDHADGRVVANANLVSSAIAQVAQSRKFVAVLKVAAAKDMSKCMEIFIRGSNDAVRNVTQPLANLTKQGQTPPPGPTKWLVERTGGKWKLDPTMKASDFLAHVSTFDNALKDIGAWLDTL